MKLTLRDPIPFPELQAKLRSLGVSLSEKQLAFLKEHDGHEKIHIEDGRVFCRTCNVRDQ